MRAFVTLQIDGRFRAELRLVQGDGERVRVLDAPTCTGLAEASAVVIALALSPETQAEAAGSSPRPFERPPAAAAPPPAEQPANVADAGTRPAVPARRRPHAWGFEASAGIATDFGATAALALGATALGRFRFDEFASFALRASFFPSRASTVPGRPNEGVNILLAAIAPLACLTPLELPFELAGCAEFEVGYLHAEGFGTQFHSGKATPWFAPGAGLSAAFPERGRLRSRLSADALFPTSRTEFTLGNVGRAHRLPPVEPRVAVSLELVFP